MPESIEVVVEIPTTAKRLYSAWLDSKAHSAFTGSPAKVQAEVGGEFSAWDGYIRGKTLELNPYQRIVQAWRTSDFPEGSPDSRLELLLTQRGKSTTLRLVHSQIPDGQSEQYRQGWLDYYFKPMEEYFTAPPA